MKVVKAWSAIKELDDDPDTSYPVIIGTSIRVGSQLSTAFKARVDTMVVNGVVTYLIYCTDEQAQAIEDFLGVFTVFNTEIVQ